MPGVRITTVSASICIIRVDPFMDDLRGHPRFDALAEKILPAREFQRAGHHIRNERAQFLQRIEAAQCRAYGGIVSDSPVPGCSMQVAGTMPMFGAPDWLPRSIVILLAIGFIPAIFSGFLN